MSDFRRIIYFSIVGRLISFVQNLLSVFSRPFMVYGYQSDQNRKFLKYTRISSSTTILNKENLNIEDNVWVWHYSILDASNGITIGKGCQIGAWVGIFTHSSHIAIRLYGGDSFIKTNLKERLGYIKAPVSIGEYSFIGARSIIMPGVQIGKGCLVAAGSIVTKSMPDYSVIVGNPAVIKGCTKDLDKKYFVNEIIRNNYFDMEVIEDFMKNH
jgi:acetyltransferase-like isoleucine patch superfamily enzyme